MDPQVCTFPIALVTIGANLTLFAWTVASYFTIPTIVTSPILLAFLVWRFLESARAGVGVES